MHAEVCLWLQVKFIWLIKFSQITEHKSVEQAHMTVGYIHLFCFMNTAYLNVI